MIYFIYISPTGCGLTTESTATTDNTVHISALHLGAGPRRASKAISKMSKSGLLSHSVLLRTSPPGGGRRGRNRRRGPPPRRHLVLQAVQDEGTRAARGERGGPPQREERPHRVVRRRRRAREAGGGGGSAPRERNPRRARALSLAPLSIWWGSALLLWVWGSFSYWTFHFLFPAC